MKRIIVMCEESARVRDALRARGYDAYSCDILPTAGDPRWHFQCDARDIINDGWDGMIAHPVCTRLANSGVRWLHEPPPGKSSAQIWDEFGKAVEFYQLFQDAKIPKKAIENPIMHKYARARLGNPKRHIVQPWWFGDKAFKATGFELYGLPPLVATNKLTPPTPGTKEHVEWSGIHRCPPGPDRAKIRSRTFTGIAEAIAEQWGPLI